MAVTVLADIEAFCQGVDEEVHLVRISSSRLVRHAREKNLPSLDTWACAIGASVRYEFGKDAEEAWNLAKKAFDARAMA